MAPSRGRATKPTFKGFDLPTEPTSPEDEGTPTAAETDHTFGKDEEHMQEVDGAIFVAQYSIDGTTSSSESSQLGSDEDDDPEQQDGPFLHHSNSSFFMTNTFAPPFYNRPPTPLPPSPSLTSLLRPPFSTTTSRPTTPDSSENDTPNDTESAVAKSARIATTVPRASPKVPTYEYYGFVLYLLSFLVFCEYLEPRGKAEWLMIAVMYLLWSYLPSPFLHQLGIYYYPNRWWSLAIPSFLVMTIIYIYVALASYNTGYLTLPMSSIENIVDSAAQIAVVDSKGRIRKKGSILRGEDDLPDPSEVDWKSLWNEGTDAVMDIPIGGVCEILYG